MTTTLPTDLRPMLAACVHDPEDDTVRLALADFLEENGMAEWAEFIRVQVELARRTITSADRKKATSILERKASGAPVRWKANTTATLLARESALLPIVEPLVRRGERCGACMGIPYPNGLRSICPTCHGRGWSGSLQIGSGPQTDADTIDNHTVPVTWRRGFPHSVTAPLADIFEGERVTEWAVRVAREWPVVEWEVSDVVIHPSGGNDKFYVGYLGRLPQKYWSRLENLPTRSAARHALARAVGAVIREAAFQEQGEGR